MTAGGGDPGSAGSVNEAMSAVADVLEARAHAIAQQVEDTYRIEIPEYRLRMDDFEEDSYGVTLAGVLGAVAVLRGTTAPLEERVALSRAFGRRRARQDFPLSAVVHGFQIGMRIFIEHVAVEAPRHGALSGAVVLQAVGELMNVVTLGVAAVSEGYEAARRDLAADRWRALDAFFSDLVLGVVSDADSARAGAMGLRSAPAYVAFATPAGAGEIDEHVEAMADGCLSGRVGATLVVIAPVDSPDDAEARARLLFPDETRLVASGGARSGLSSVRAGYEDALQTLELARRLGLSGRVQRRDVLVPGLLASTPTYALELASLLDPLVAADGKSEARLVPTLRAYLASGLSPYKTAAALFVHRNTLRARLRRIEQLLGAPIIDIHLALQLALLARDLDLPVVPREIP
ncbi:MAG: helix-turn-helix domain-containing protein [Actinobacteria bacterium]|nr:helix-turn-helix domain-containing protein [Actinomycetota bacterium]MBV8960092.1 helix-turn-helix domain-containing protein [Actinomycetota bacterium]MBV9254020.1 helix-turn-helix domain-containing protein [Actinomycetota bacterium]